MADDEESAGDSARQTVYLVVVGLDLTTKMREPRGANYPYGGRIKCRRPLTSDKSYKNNVGPVVSS